MFQTIISYIASLTGLPAYLVPWAAGLLAVVVALALFGLLRKTRYRPTVYGRQQYLFTKTEWPFMRQLMAEFERDYMIVAKVRMADLLKVKKMRSRKVWWQAFTRISSKHIDFVLVDPGTGRILCCIELDDPSHNRTDRQGRDAFVNRAFAGANLPLLRIPTQRQYDMKAIRQQVQRQLS